MKLSVLGAAAAALALGACAGGREAPLAEQGYPPGSLAVAAIDRGDFQRAEYLLEERSPLGAGHPARLINLGTVYAQTGRMELARDTWRRALNSSREAMVATGDGRFVSTRQLARQALANVETRIVAR